MANAKIIIITIFLVAVLLVSAFGVAKLLDSPNLAEYTVQAQTIFNQAITEAEQIRNITLPHVDLEVITRQWAMDVWGKGYADSDVQNILRQEVVYKGLFIIPEDANLYQASVDWAGSFGAATWNGKIYVVRENFDPWKMPDAEATFVHELMHIWQHGLPSPGSFDADKAYSALIEGDASYMGDYFKNQTKARQVRATISIDQVPLILLGNGLQNELRPSIPSAISYLNYFPYDYGTIYVHALYQKGGWAAVNQAYLNPADTTEQILHPDKYFSNETCQHVAAPRLSEKDWALVKSDRYGEFFVRVMLHAGDTWGNWLSQAEAQEAAAGWSGDNFTYYERGSEYLFTWNIKWDSSHDASEFYAAFNRMVNATGAAKSCSCWQANGRYLSITWNQDLNSTLIACSTNKTAVLPSYFT